MAKRFLVTTSDERTWKTDEKILFLGEWCKLLSRRNIWDQLDYKVLPYHWDDRNRLLSDYNYLISIYEKYLEILTQKLNHVHGENHSIEYWRIVIGPWLQIFVSTVFDKWLSIEEALRIEKITGTWVLDFGKEGMIPFGMKDMQHYSCSDLWNHHVYSQIILATQDIPYKTIESSSALEGPKLKHISTKNLTILAKNIAHRVGRMIPDRFNKVVFICNNFSNWDLIKLQVSLGQFPCLLHSKITIKNISTNPTMRNDLEIKEASSNFEKVLEKLIPANIPKLNVELYSKLCEQVSKRFPKKLSTIVTTHGYWVQDDFKVWAAQKKENGAKLVVGQHGGLFGSALIEQSEEQQIKISDLYGTWGWKDREHSHVRPLPPPKLAYAIKKSISPKPDGQVLWAWGADFAKYFFRMHSIPIGPQSLNYIYDQIEFGKNISDEGLKILKLRLRPKGKFLWEEGLYIREAGLDKIIDHSDQDFYEQLNESRLCITTDNSTVFLETLALNFPTVLFWDPRHWELRASAQPFYDELRRVNILHNSPKSAAATVNKIHKDPSEWWFQPERQKVIKSFCKEFACFNSNWLRDWKNELETLSLGH